MIRFASTNDHELGYRPLKLDQSQSKTQTQRRQRAGKFGLSYHDSIPARLARGLPGRLDILQLQASYETTLSLFSVPPRRGGREKINQRRFSNWVRVAERYNSARASRAGMEKIEGISYSNWVRVAERYNSGRAGREESIIGCIQPSPARQECRSSEICWISNDNNSQLRANNSHMDVIACPAIDVRGVSKRFGATSVLDSICLTVAQGEIFALLGASGSGKSTLLKIISGIE